MSAQKGGPQRPRAIAQTVQSTHDLRLLCISHWPATSDSGRLQSLARSGSSQPEEAVPARLSPDDVSCPSCAASCDGAHPISDCFLQLNPASAQSSAGLNDVVLLCTSKITASANLPCSKPNQKFTNKSSTEHNGNTIDTDTVKRAATLRDGSSMVDGVGRAKGCEAQGFGWHV
jgi:hypothetical protein